MSASESFDPPVTVTVVREVKPGCTLEFERLITELSKHANRSPGHLGTNFFRPVGNYPEYRIIYKFDSMSHFHQWETSETRVKGIDIKNLGSILLRHFLVTTYAHAQSPEFIL